jgi:hypothetical protein
MKALGSNYSRMDCCTLSAFFDFAKNASNALLRKAYVRYLEEKQRYQKNKGVKYRFGVFDLQIRGWP